MFDDQSNEKKMINRKEKERAKRVYFIERFFHSRDVFFFFVLHLYRRSFFFPSRFSHFHLIFITFDRVEKKRGEKM